MAMVVVLPVIIEIIIIIVSVSLSSTIMAFWRTTLVLSSFKEQIFMS
jgi:hypothetical protein